MKAQTNGRVVRGAVEVPWNKGGKPRSCRANNGIWGSLPCFAAFANRKDWAAAPSVRFLQVARSNLQVQLRSGFRQICQTGMSALELTAAATAIIIELSCAGLKQTVLTLE